MSMTLLEALALPDEFLHPEKHHCGLCGNSGTIDTRGRIFTAAGVECGIKAPCVCANGRALKRGPKAPVQKPPETFWVSWDDFSDKDPERLGDNIIESWTTGEAGDGSYVTVVAWVIGSTLAEVVTAVDAAFPCDGDRRWRFINPCDTDEPTGGRFTLSKEGAAKLKKFKARSKK